MTKRHHSLNPFTPPYPSLLSSQTSFKTQKKDSKISNSQSFWFLGKHEFLCSQPTSLFDRHISANSMICNDIGQCCCPILRYWLILVVQVWSLGFYVKKCSINILSYSCFHSGHKVQACSMQFDLFVHDLNLCSHCHSLQYSLNLQRMMDKLADLSCKTATLSLGAYKLLHIHRYDR